MSSLKNRTIFITGASRGIGREIALRCAREGANLVIAAKTVEPHAKLEGTIHQTAEAVEAAGGRALAIQLDVREEMPVREALEKAASHFGGIDAIVNNAGAIGLTNVEMTAPKKFDLMMGINARAVYLMSHCALPYLKKSANAHILSLSPPLNLKPQWLKPYAPYTLSKYGMTLLSLGLAEELRDARIAVNTLWPRTLIATAAVEFSVGGRDLFKVARKPDIMADAAYEILRTGDLALTGRNLIDEALLRERGVTDFTHYAWDPTQADRLGLDLYVDA
ncbi:MAG: SDR family oxidoreductase [Pseudomonadota bacterium]